MGRIYELTMDFNLRPDAQAPQIFLYILSIRQKYRPGLFDRGLFACFKLTILYPKI